jgi:hypothetical protein
VLVLAASPAQAHPGVGIVMDRQGNVYYTDLTQVWRIGTDGRKTVVVRNVHTHELWVDPDGTLYGEHLWYNGERENTWGHRVWKRTPDGRVTDVIPSSPGFLADYGFARDSTGMMYFVERGETTVFRKRRGAGPVTTCAVCRDCRHVGWQYATPGGTLYFVDAGDLRRVTPDGRVTTVAPGLARVNPPRPGVEDTEMTMGLWSDRAGNVYVTVWEPREVRKVAPDGRVSVAARGDSTWGITGGLTAPNGDLWLLETSTANAVRVRRLTPGGSATVY